MSPAACVFASCGILRCVMCREVCWPCSQSLVVGPGSFCRDTKGRHWGSHSPTLLTTLPLLPPPEYNVFFTSGYCVFQRLQVPRSPHYIARDWHGCVSRSGCSPGTAGIAPPWSAGIGLFLRISAYGKAYRPLLASLPCSSTERRLGRITVEKGSGSGAIYRPISWAEIRPACKGLG